MQDCGARDEPDTRGNCVTCAGRRCTARADQRERGHERACEPAGEFSERGKRIAPPWRARGDAKAVGLWRHYGVERESEGELR